MSEIIYTSPCKFNPYLDILGLRPDGYHEVATILEPLSLHDRLIVKDIPRGIKITSDHPGVPSGEANIVFQAVELVRQQTGITRGVSIQIEKKVPVAAGLGGGSANAAAALRALDRLWELKFSKEDLSRLAGRLGSDVPFFLEPRTSLCEGRGERITFLNPLPPLWVVLINPGFPLSTKWAYARVDEAGIRPPSGLARMLEAIESRDLASIAGLMHNAFQEVISEKVPEVKEALDFLRRQEVLSALLAGSGATVVGVVDTEEKARRISRGAQESFPPTWFIAVSNNLI